MTSEHEPSRDQMHRLVHRYEHLRRRKGLDALPEGPYAGECWSVIGGPSASVGGGDGRTRRARLPVVPRPEPRPVRPRARLGVDEAVTQGV